MILQGPLSAELEQSTEGQVRKVAILRNAKTLRYADVIEAWQSDEAFRTFFLSLLRASPYAAYYWETPPITTSTLNKSFEFVLIDSPPLATVTPDTQAFASYFDSDCADKDIVSFANLGGDAYLIAPCPVGCLTAYPHLGSFTREAPLHQQHALWQSVGGAVEKRLSEKPVWVSTAGLGVYWLHVRLDSRPKYYNYRPYQALP